jgi:hypothetical protein
MTCAAPVKGKKSEQRKYAIDLQSVMRHPDLHYQFLSLPLQLPFLVSLCARYRIFGTKVGGPILKGRILHDEGVSWLRSANARQRSSHYSL